MRMVVTNSTTSVVSRVYYNGSFVEEFHDPLANAITNPGSIGFQSYNAHGVVDDVQVFADDGSQMVNDTVFRTSTGWTLGPWRDRNSKAIKFLAQETYPEFKVYFADVTNMAFPSLWVELDTITVTNFSYKSHTVMVNTSRQGHVFLDRPSSGGGNAIRIDDVRFTSWEAANFTSNDWQISFGNIRNSGLSIDSNYLELRKSKALDQTNQYVRSEVLAGIGAVGFRHFRIIQWHHIRTVTPCLTGERSHVLTVSYQSLGLDQ